MGRDSRRAQRPAGGSVRSHSECGIGAKESSSAGGAAGRMISSAIIPQPLARLPWRLIFLVMGIAMIGLMTLYSTAGGSIRPWALKQGITLLVFLAIAISMSWLKESLIKSIVFPFYAAVLIMLVLVEA